jgi:phage terminase small subunit
MDRGRKLSNPAHKALANTHNVTRDRNINVLATVTADAPVAPDWLPDRAAAVWDVDLPRVTACGATSTDSQMFALYCVTMADFIAGVNAGEAPNAAFRSELRKQMEMLCIAGAKSRLAKIANGSPQTANPFSVRPQ